MESSVSGSSDLPLGHPWPRIRPSLLALPFTGARCRGAGGFETRPYNRMEVLRGYAAGPLWSVSPSFDFASLRSGRTARCGGVLRLRFATLRTNGCKRCGVSPTVLPSLRYAQDTAVNPLWSVSHHPSTSPLRSGRTAIRCGVIERLQNPCGTARYARNGCKSVVEVPTASPSLSGRTAVNPLWSVSHRPSTSLRYAQDERL